MSLERKDVRLKLDPDIHRALVAICAGANKDIAEMVEHLVVDEVKRRVHEAIVLSNEMQRLGIAGKLFPGEK